MTTIIKAKPVKRKMKRTLKRVPANEKAMVLASTQVVKAGKNDLRAINCLTAKIGDGEIKSAKDFWVAKFEGRIIGCIGLDLINHEVGVVTHVVVDEYYRKVGISRKLMIRCLSEACKRGLKQMTLITMYYCFNYFKLYGFNVIRREKLPEAIKNYEQFTSKRYMKCAVMINPDLRNLKMRYKRPRSDRPFLQLEI